MSAVHDAIVPWLAGAWQVFAARVVQQRVPHGILVSGPAGLGKRAFVGALTASEAAEMR